jgi:hypothetical protein
MKSLIISKRIPYGQQALMALKALNADFFADIVRNAYPVGSAAYNIL